jgi:hypothetical protein
MVAAQLGMSQSAVARTWGEYAKVRDQDRPQRTVGRHEGLDGKLYPDRKLTAAERRCTIREIHRLRHEGKSVRQVQAGLTYRVSVGWIHHALNEWTCSPECKEALSKKKRQARLIKLLAEDN